MSAKREVKTVRIDKEGRYAMIFQAKTDSDMSVLHLDDIQDSLRRWWEGADKFYLLSVRGFRVRLERVDKEV